MKRITKKWERSREFSTIIFPQPVPIAIDPLAGMSRSSDTDMATYALKHLKNKI